MPQSRAESDEGAAKSVRGLVANLLHDVGTWPAQRACITFLQHIRPHLDDSAGPAVDRCVDEVKAHLRGKQRDRGDAASMVTEHTTDHPHVASVRAAGRMSH